MNCRVIPVMMLFLSLLTVPGFSHGKMGGAFDVRIVSDNGYAFPRYRAFPRTGREGMYYYMEAAKGDRYSIEVRNITGSRLGVVIAVDGRNIISGEKSDLGNTERMYIIGPYDTNVFEGWRTGMDRTNRFYFTRQSDSYAEKVFSDASAMGTIAVAVYREKLPDAAQISRMHNSGPRSGSTKSGQSREETARGEKDEHAGTGFGETNYSPCRVVEFNPESLASGTVVFKYEWREALCRKGIIFCGKKNRFWPYDLGFAPVPEDFRE
jgi:hypothetical protein